MTSPMHSTIAQLLYPSAKAVDFARIVAELETVLSRLRGAELEVEWDCDDVVTFDTADTRILLAHGEYGRAGHEACLTIAVGPRHELPFSATLDTVDYQGLCSRLVEKIQARNKPRAILWREVDTQLSAEVSDEMMEALPQVEAILPPVDSILDQVMRTDLFKTTPMRGHEARQTLHKRTLVARRNLHYRGGYSREEIQARLRQTFARPAPVPRPQQSLPMQMTAHCFNTAMILVYPPLGMAVTAYSLIQGADLRLSARLMSLAGTCFALSQTPIGQFVATVAGSMVHTA